MPRDFGANGMIFRGIRQMLIGWETYNYTIDYAKSKFAEVWRKSYSLIANCNKLWNMRKKMRKC